MLNSGRTKDLIMGALLRNIWLCKATQELELRALHLPGAEIRLADCLSRWHLNPDFYATKFFGHCDRHAQFQVEQLFDDIFSLNERI